MYETTESSTEIEFVIEDETPQAVFSESVVAFSDVLEEAYGGEPVSHEVVLSADTLPGLLGAWMAELVRLAESEGFVPERVTKLRLAGSSVRAVLAGERGLPQGKIRRVAYDHVDVKKLDSGAWAARVVLDL